MKKIIYKSHYSYRTLPSNLKEEDKWLFEREFVRKIPNGYIRKIKNVTYLNQNFYKFMGSFQFNQYTQFSKKKLKNYFKDFLKYYLISGKSIKIDNAIWIFDNKSHVYGHFFNDSMCRLIMIPEELRNNFEIIVPDEQNKKWILDFLDFFELKYKIFDTNQKYKIKNLHTANFPALPGNFNKEVLNKLKKQMLEKYSESKIRHQQNFNFPKRVWIDRSNSRRKILNFNEIFEVLEKYEFQTICLEDLSISEKIGLLQNVEILAGSHGSGLANMTLMKKNTNILDIRDPEDKFKNAFFSQASALGINYFYMEREVNNESLDPINEDLTIDSQKLSYVIEKILNS